MTRNPLLFIPFGLFFIGSMACKTDSPRAEDTPPGLDSSANNLSPSNRLYIRFGSRTFTATLLNNPTVAAFKTRLPITLSMNELNRNEKYAELSTPLPVNAANPRTIQPGDLMLYGATTLVLSMNHLKRPTPIPGLVVSIIRRICQPPLVRVMSRSRLSWSNSLSI
jgi:hypothetical protein